MKSQEEGERTAAPPVEVEVTQVGTAIVRLRGEHDLTTTSLVREALASAAVAGNVLVDLSECTFADSSLVAALAAAREDVSKRDGRIEIVIPPEATAARRLAELARLADIVPIHGSWDAAIGSPSPGA